MFVFFFFSMLEMNKFFHAKSPNDFFQLGVDDLTLKVFRMKNNTDCETLIKLERIKLTHFHMFTEGCFYNFVTLIDFTMNLLLK